MPDYETLMYWHLATVLPAAVLGAVALAQRKGDARHKLLGRGYALLMAATALITVFMPARVGPQWPVLGLHFGFIHLLVPLVLLTLWRALAAVRRGNVRVHRKAMISLYIAGVIVPGLIAAAVPGRFLPKLLFG